MNKADNTVGINIRRLRKNNGLKQSALAMVLNIRRQTVSGYERGVCLPDIYMLIRIADFFDVTLDELSGRTALIIPDEIE